MIRIDDIRALHHDLHMRPFEGDTAGLRRARRAPAQRGCGGRAAEGPRGAARLRDDGARRGRARAAAGDDPLALSARAVPAALRPRGAKRGSRAGARASTDEAALLARVAGGRLDRAARLLDPAARERGSALARRPRGRVYATTSSTCGRPRRSCLERRAAGAAARASEQEAVGRPRPPRARAEQRVDALSAAPSARSCSRRSTSSPPGTATSSWSPRARTQAVVRRPAGRAALDVAAGAAAAPSAPRRLAGSRGGRSRSST